jgi:branched-chain amino acid transport system permease protein
VAAARGRPFACTHIEDLVPGYVLLLNLLFEGVISGLIYALIALGFSLIWRVCDVIHLAHGGVLLIAGTAVYVAAKAGIWLPVAIVLGCLAAVVAGLLTEEFLYRPMRQRGSGEFGLITVSLGALIVIQYAIVVILGPDDMAIHAPVLRQPLFPGQPLTFDLFSILVIASVGILFVACGVLLSSSGMGKAMRALASNAELATIVGLDVKAARRNAMVLGSVMTVPAAVLTLCNTGITPTDGLHIVLVAATVSILGGRGSLAGALIGGLVIGLAESLMVYQFPYGWRQVITFVPLYLLLLLRPQGLLGGRA